MKWKINHMDVKNAFLNGVVEEEVYVEQPVGFETHDRETHMYKLNKALYGLKHTPTTWYSRIDSFLTSLGFNKSKVDSNLYYKVEEGNPMIILLYMDDLFVIGEDGLIDDTKRTLATEFEMKYLGMLHYFLGMEVWQNADGNIEKYKSRLLECGFSQKEGIDYEETFAHVARYTSIRSVLALDAVMKWKIH